jgi:hypothetical protein
MNKYLLSILLLAGCANNPTPPNDPIGYKDAQEHANFHYMMTGSDFPVDMQGHNYTLNGANLNYDQMRDLFFYISPWTLEDIKNFILVYCHSRQSTCTYSKAQDYFARIESDLKKKMSLEMKSFFDDVIKQKELELEKMIK